MVVFAVWLISTAAALIAAGSSLTILSFTISPQILSFVGYGILLGGGFGGLTSWLSGNEFMSMEMLTDTLFGCIAGGIGGLFGELIGGARFVTWLGSKIPWLPTVVKGSVGAGVEQSVFDFFKTGKINVKNTLIAIGVGGLLSYGGWLFSNNFDSIVTSINKISLPTVKMQVLASAGSNLPFPSIKFGQTKIEDTQFGAWLQKFASNGKGSGSKGPETPNVEKYTIEVKTPKQIDPRGPKPEWFPEFKQEEIALKTYERLRSTGLDKEEIDTFAKNTGLSVEEAKQLKSHLFLTEHVNLAEENGKYYYKGYFNPDIHIAYGWEQALKRELTPDEKAWFRQLADHELAESKMMQEGMPYRDIQSFEPGKGFTKNPPGAHDLAPAQPGDFPGFKPNLRLIF